MTNRRKKRLPSGRFAPCAPALRAGLRAYGPLKMPALRAETFYQEPRPHQPGTPHSTAPASRSQQRVISGSRRPKGQRHTATSPLRHFATSRKPGRTTRQGNGLQPPISRLTALQGGRVAPCTADKRPRSSPTALRGCSPRGRGAGGKALPAPHAEAGGVPGRQGRGRFAVAQARALTPLHLNGKP